MARMILRKFFGAVAHRQQFSGGIRVCHTERLRAVLSCERCRLQPIADPIPKSCCAASRTRSAAPANVEVERTGGTLTLQFQRHDRGGLVQVTVNGNSRPVDLYAPEIGVETLTFLPAVSADQNPPELLAARTHGAPGGFRNFRLATDPPGHVEIQSVKLNGDRLTELSPGIYAAGANYWTARSRAILASLLTLVAVAATLLLVVLAWRRGAAAGDLLLRGAAIDRKSTRLNSS